MLPNTKVFISLRSQIRGCLLHISPEICKLKCFLMRKKLQYPPLNDISVLFLLLVLPQVVKHTFVSCAVRSLNLSTPKQ